MTYIAADSKDNAASSSTRKAGCIFCDKPRQESDDENLIIYRGVNAFVLLNLYPYNNGHMMVAPYLHTAKLAELSPECLSEMMRLVQNCEAALYKAYAPQGYNIGMNLGEIAGAGIADHLHMHIVPRWSGDTNFMPVIGETKVLPDSLSGSYEKILTAWHELANAE
jgi:ATP adenylyltransferase